MILGKCFILFPPKELIATPFNGQHDTVLANKKCFNLLSNIYKIRCTVCMTLGNNQLFSKT